jgi:hypothetical protein
VVMKGGLSGDGMDAEWAAESVLHLAQLHAQASTSTF